MREILFRGKRMDNGEWIEGNYIRKNDPSLAEPTFWCSLIQDMALSAYEVIPETVGQLTGLTDKNGKKIFEGDKLRFEDDQESIVKWMQGGLTIEADFGDYDLTTVGWAIDILGCCEVIGNIHSNPEPL